MGEKKRRLAAGGKTAVGTPALLDARLATYLDECRQLEQVIAARQDEHAALFQLSQLRQRISLIHRERNESLTIINQHMNRGLEAISQALWIAPQTDLYWLQFADCIKPALLEHPLDAQAREMMMRALEHPAVQPISLLTPVVSLLQSHPAISEIEDHLSGEAASDATSDARLLACAGQFAPGSCFRNRWC